MAIWRILGLEGTETNEKGLFFITITVVIGMIVWGFTAPDSFANVLNGAFDWVLKWWGWWFILLSFVLLAAMAFFAFSRYGRVRIGGPDAEPEFDLFSWFSMIFTVGFASSVIFWGVAEPIYIVDSPPSGGFPVSGNPESIALAFMFLHDILPGLVSWYLPFAVAFGMVLFTRGVDRYKVSSVLEPVLDPEEYKWLFWIVDLAALIAIVGGLSTTLGFIGQQMATILSGVFGLAGNVWTYALFAVIGVVFLGDVWLGLRAGIRNAARLTVIIVIVLMTLLFFVGPTMYMLNLGLDAAGIWLNNLPRLMLYTSVQGSTTGTWAQAWTSFWWAWWAAWGIFVGAFVARVSKGRTLREMFIGLGVIPAFFLWIQHTILGGWALAEGYKGPITEALNNQGIPAALAAALNITPLGGLLGILFVLAIAGYVITSLDSAVYMLSGINLGDEEPNARNRAWWGVLLAALGIMTLEIPGASALEAFSPVMALPFSVVYLAIIYTSYKVAAQTYREHHTTGREVQLLTRGAAGAEESAEAGAEEGEPAAGGDD